MKIPNLCQGVGPQYKVRDQVFPELNDLKSKHFYILSQ